MSAIAKPASNRFLDLDRTPWSVCPAEVWYCEERSYSGEKEGFKSSGNRPYSSGRVHVSWRELVRPGWIGCVWPHWASWWQICQDLPTPPILSPTAPINLPSQCQLNTNSTTVSAPRENHGPPRVLVGMGTGLRWVDGHNGNPRVHRLLCSFRISGGGVMVVY